MGRWKYLNLLIVGLILYFMLGTLAARYQVSLVTYAWVIGAIVLITVTGYYMFVVAFFPKKQEPDNDELPLPNRSPSKPRPKVVLRPKNKNDE